MDKLHTNLKLKHILHVGNFKNSNYKNTVLAFGFQKSTTQWKCCKMESKFTFSLKCAIYSGRIVKIFCIFDLKNNINFT